MPNSRRMMMAAAGAAGGGIPEGALYAWGSGSTLRFNYWNGGSTVNVCVPTQLGSDTNWATASSGGTIVCATRTDGTVWTWGYSNDGALGNGTSGWGNNISSPGQVGSGTTWTTAHCGKAAFGAGFRVLKSDGSIWTTGDGSGGVLGNGSISDVSTPVLVSGSHTWVSHHSGNGWTQAIDNLGQLWIWGNGNAARQGNLVWIPGATSTPVQTGSDTDWLKAVSIGSHCIGLKDTGKIYTWGWGYFGAPGHGDTADLCSPVQVGTSTGWTDIATGDNHWLAINGGELFTCGKNELGELGDGTTTNRCSPVKIGSKTDWSQVACSQRASLAQDANGNIFCWGKNSSGAVGDGTTTDRSSPVMVANAATTSKIQGSNCSSNDTFWVVGGA